MALDVPGKRRKFRVGRGNHACDFQPPGAELVMGYCLPLDG